MEIKQKNNDGLTIDLDLHIVKDDYAEKRKKHLNDFRKSAEIKGFRKGMVPISLVEKMHGHSALVDSINELISESLNKYIEENNLKLIGEPLPKEGSDTKNDWNNGEEFDFGFELALAPEVAMTLSAEDQITLYNVKITAKAKSEYKDNLLKQYGKLEETEIAGEDAFIVADLIQGETAIEGTYISVKSLTEQEAKDLFIGKKKGDELDIDVNAVFTNETDRASLLRVKKEELPTLDPNYKVVIKEVKDFMPAKPDQEFYDMAFGPGVVTDEKGFDAKVTERLKDEYAQEIDYRFMLDSRDYLINKANIKLPEDFMKRWLYVANEGKFSMEEIEKEFDLFAKDFRWQLIAGYIMKEQDLKVTKEAMLEHAMRIAAYQFSMYGLNNVPSEQLHQYAESMLTNEKEGRRIYEKVEEDLVVAYVRSVVTMDKKDITIDKLRKLVQ